MATIQQYPLKTPTLNDTLVGTKLPSTATGSPTTSNFSLAAITTLVNSTSTIPINDVGIWFQTTLANTDSPRTDDWFEFNNVFYASFQANFENLVLEAGSTYKLIIERWKKGDNGVLGRSGARSSSFKRQDIASLDSAEAPYNQRPVEIEITSLSQDFDFRPDLYYSNATSPEKKFPRPSGYSKQTAGRNSSRQHFVFRISKEALGVTEVSQVLAKAILIGDTSESNKIVWKFW